MRIISISEAKRQIKNLIEHASRSDQVYYITRYSQAKAVVLGIEHYENLLQRIEQLEDGLVRVWAAIEGEEGEEAIMVPTPDGRWRLFHPTRPVSSEVHAAIQRAARLAWQRRDWTLDRTVQEGRQAIERARQEAIARGTAIEDERMVCTSSTLCAETSRPKKAIDARHTSESRRWSLLASTGAIVLSTGNQLLHSTRQSAPLAPGYFPLLCQSGTPG